MNNTAQVRSLKEQMEAIQRQLDNLESQPGNTLIAAKAVEEFIKINGSEFGDLTAKKTKELWNIARKIGFSGTKNALRSTFLMRKYWLRMEKHDW